MGNRISVRPSDATSKIVHWDGSVQEFDQPVTVAELMLEHPQQVVVEFHSAVNQKRPIPLPADNVLEKSKMYLMLPMKRGKRVGLNSEESRRILLVVNSSLRSSRFLPWLDRLCQNNAIEDSGVVVQGQGKGKEEDMEKKEERLAFSEFLPEMVEGMRPEYLSRQLSGKGWKPGLDTIKEKKIERKLSYRLFLKSF